MTITTRWTPAQAGYDMSSLRVTTSRLDGTGLVQHYTRTRHGVVARTWCGTDLAEVVLRRPSHVRGTYQGHVKADAGSGTWTAYDATHQRHAGPFANYLDAEATLLRLRTGQTARGTYRWNCR